MKKLVFFIFVIFSIESFAQKIGSNSVTDVIIEDTKNLRTEDAARFAKCNITYFIMNGTNDIAGTSEDTYIQAAFGIWESHTDLHFTRVYSSVGADIILQFVQVSPYSLYPFNNCNQFPLYIALASLGNNTIYFNDKLTFAHNPPLSSGNCVFDMTTIAAHEIGHILGLGHYGSTSGTPTLMQNGYSGIHQYLNPDDITKIQTFYPNGIIGTDNICFNPNKIFHYSYPSPNLSNLTNWTSPVGLAITQISTDTKSISLKGLTHGIHQLCVNSNGCSSCKNIAVINLTVPPAPIIFERAGGNSSCSDEFRAVTNPYPGATQYQWSTNNFVNFTTTTQPFTDYDYPIGLIALKVRVVTQCGASAARLLTTTLLHNPNCPY